MSDTTTTEKPKKPKRKLTTAEKRARTRRRNAIAKRAGIKGKAARTALHKMEEIAASLTGLSDYELVQLKKSVDALIAYRKQQQRIFKSIYERT